MDSIRRGEHGQPYSSDYVLDETVTATLVRTGRVATAIKVGKLLLGSAEERVPPLVRMVRVDEQAFGDAWKTFRSGKFERLSFTDHTILGQVRRLGIDSVASFDSGFDGLVTRVP